MKSGIMTRARLVRTLPIRQMIAEGGASEAGESARARPRKEEERRGDDGEKRECPSPSRIDKARAHLQAPPIAKRARWLNSARRNFRARRYANRPQGMKPLGTCSARAAYERLARGAWLPGRHGEAPSRAPTLVASSHQWKGADGELNAREQEAGRAPAGVPSRKLSMGQAKEEAEP